MSNDTARNMLERRMAANCTVRDGQLVITARQEQIPGTTQLYTSGYVDTIGRDCLLGPGGLWVTRALLPTAPTAGRGMWSALWARSDTGSGEIDVMEGYSDKPDLANAWECVVFTIHADTMVAGGNSKNYVHRFPAGQYPYLVPHEYGVELATDRLRFSIDGTVVWEPTVVAYPWLATMLTNTYNLRVNQQISAASDYFYAPDAGTQFPREMTVDYTRVYKKP
jgi:beta-glucanase (GH16 family)